jgi:hypothetical protein
MLSLVRAAPKQAGRGRGDAHAGGEQADEGGQLRARAHRARARAKRGRVDRPLQATARAPGRLGPRLQDAPQ